MKRPVGPEPKKTVDCVPKPVVAMSIENDTGLHCVDILELPGHGFGFREFRRDLEDPHGWRPPVWPMTAPLPAVIRLWPKPVRLQSG